MEIRRWIDVTTPADGSRPPLRQRQCRAQTRVKELVASALLAGDAEALVHKAVELAKRGNVVMLKFLVGRILPRERLIQLALPRMDFADDAVEAPGG